MAAGCLNVGFLFCHINVLLVCLLGKSRDIPVSQPHLGLH